MKRSSGRASSDKVRVPSHAAVVVPSLVPSHAPHRAQLAGGASASPTAVASARLMQETPSQVDLVRGIYVAERHRASGISCFRLRLRFSALGRTASLSSCLGEAHARCRVRPQANAVEEEELLLVDDGLKAEECRLAEERAREEAVAAVRNPRPRGRRAAWRAGKTLADPWGGVPARLYRARTAMIVTHQPL